MTDLMNKVVWTEGMFLRPHHFQQMERYIEHYIAQRVEALDGYFWGFQSLVLDTSLLQQGKVSLHSARGIMPDGTPFSFSGAKSAPIPLTVPENAPGATLVLAIPLFRPGRNDVVFEDSPDVMARYLAYDADVDDMNTVSVGSATLQFGKLRMRLMFEHEISAEWVALKVAYIAPRREGESIKLAPSVIPTMLNSLEETQLKGFINDLQGMLKQHTYQLSQRLQQPGRGGRSEMVDFMRLQLLNRYTGIMEHLATLRQLHPERLYAWWLTLYTELMSFSAQRTAELPLPRYLHDNQMACFSELMTRLREGLSIMSEDDVLQLTITPQAHGLNVVSLPSNTLLVESDIILAVQAAMPVDALLERFQNQVKVASMARIQELVQFQLPGLTLRPLPFAPRQMPYHAGYSYFELEKQGERWKEMENASALALHLSGDFPGLMMECWAIRISSIKGQSQ